MYILEIGETAWAGGYASVVSSRESASRDGTQCRFPAVAFPAVSGLRNMLTL